MDLLLISSCDAERSLLASTLRQIKGVRVKEASSGKEAAASLAVATPNAVICREVMDDVRSTQLIRMIRNGVFGFDQTPVVVLAERPELMQLCSPSDVHTFYLELVSASETAQRIYDLLKNKPRPTVLYIEDNVDYSTQFGAMLSSQFDLEVQADGASGLSAWLDRRHDVVLLDLMLPSMSGEVVLAAIKAERQNQPVVILTAYDDLEKHKELVLAGASAFLSKGVEPLRAAATIAAVLKEVEADDMAKENRERETQMRDIAAHVHAAHYNLTRGKTSLANAQLSDAVQSCPSFAPSDDDWLRLVADNT
jgi:DNA-binding response OmpR family regulator